VNLKVELLDILSVIVLVSIVLLGYVLISPTAIQQDVSAMGLMQKSGQSAHFYLNISAQGGFREIQLNIGDIHFNGPTGWSYVISQPSFTVESSHNFSNEITIAIPQNASVGDNATLSFLLYSKGNPSAFSNTYTLTVTASTSSFVQQTGEILTATVSGVNFVPWFAVVGPIALVTAMVGVGIIAVRNRR
jgi:uncharacterized membrane protein